MQRIRAPTRSEPPSSSHISFLHDVLLRKRLTSMDWEKEKKLGLGIAAALVIGFTT